MRSRGAERVSEGLLQSADECRIEGMIAAGDLASGRAALQAATMPADRRAFLFCRLAEALFYRGRHGEAVECAEAAFELAPEGEAIADFCGWLFSNCGRHGLAAAAYERLLACRPGWAEGHRHASGSFAMTGDIERAIGHAQRACELAPTAVEFALHAGALCAATGLLAAAHAHFEHAGEIAPDDPVVLRQLSASALALGDADRACKLALAAYARAHVSGDPGGAHHAAEVLLRSNRFDEAVRLIAAAIGDEPADAALYRLLSAAEMQCGAIEAALAAIERAIALAPANAEYHQHRGGLLHRVGRFEDAARAFDRAAALDPGNPAPKRSQLEVYCETGRLREAVIAGGELIRLAPDDEDHAHAVLDLLNRRLEMLNGDYVVLGERTVPIRRATPSRGPMAAVRTQCRVITALMIREARTRFGESRLGYGWALLEPILHILMLSLVFAVLMHGRPPIGPQFFIFYYTGIIPYHIFVHSSSSMTYAIVANGALLQLPLVATFDVILARGLLEFATDISVAVILLAGFNAIGLAAMPADFGGVAAAVLAAWLLGCGCGFVNAVINAFCKSWDKVWAQITRVLYFCSGIFYVPAMMPQWIRDELAWNPVLQAVDWFRAGFFADYAPHWLDRTYMIAAGGSLLAAGLALERGLRHRLCEPL
jgi:ABC-type polysaccharide/polyol phosphate export permease/Flp pilus assembly protein TadD